MLLDDSPVVPSIACEVTNSRSGGEGRRSSVAANHTLKLFIFLEPASSQGSRRAGSDNEQWRQNVEVLYEMRRSFDSLVVSHSRKFHQALHSVLNKLICNYGTHEKVRHTEYESHYSSISCVYMSWSELFLPYVMFADQLSNGDCHPHDSRGCFKHRTAQQR